MVFAHAHEAQRALHAALSAECPEFGPQLAKAAYARGLAVTSQDGSTQPIPIAATPIVVDAQELSRRQSLAAHLASATLKLSSHLLSGAHGGFILEGLSPVERQLTLRTFQALHTLATTRVDFFACGQALTALEVNATIPAMQGYSDIAADTFLEVLGRRWGASQARIAGWKAHNGSNTKALYQALLASYQRLRPGRLPGRIALLCRRNDAQLTEQRYLCASFQALGCEADVVFPDELYGERRVCANGKRYDLVYRHLFARRLEAMEGGAAAFLKGFFAEENGTRAVLFNPPAAQVEVKAMFALLSEADAKLTRAAGLNALELAAIAQAVPWTRRFHGAPLVKKIAALPDSYVLKRSWDYGGRTVFIGRMRHEASFAERVHATYGEAGDWAMLCARAAQDRAGGGFIVQKFVETAPERHFLCHPNHVSQAELFVDFSAFASVGLPAQPAWSGVCRGGVSSIVNIVGGGGVLPLLVTEVAQSLLATQREWSKKQASKGR